MSTVALLVVAASVVIAPLAAPAAAESAQNDFGPDGPVSGRLVPALRGAAADAAAGSHVTDRYRDIAMARNGTEPARTNDITPWTGALHTVWGVFPHQASIGAQATHTINPGIRLSPNNPDVIYAPTLDPSGKTCIEVTTFYFNGGNGVGAWDWCAAQPGFAAVAWIDANFISTYTRPFQGQPAYTVRDVQTNPVTNSWTAYLFNHNTGSWDELFTSANTSKLTETHGGWDMFEVYTEYNPATGEGHYCTETYGSMWFATNIQVKFGSTWQTLTPANSSVPHTGDVRSTDFGCYSLSFTLQTPNSTWQVTH
ncbi:MAG TPA: carbohydrate-binding protein [Actinophytocola sp.]|uniref:carbohydrate-binding protein n=1 Tax=Actinophytocola sp. TaxID=1872138 RepID=UPI002DC02CEC|nr:carbohydrate-binding protein [Actinophytocola sp.]HEU5474651.1 carbohydrate-binding protein [Actinophytocola sp.]